MQKHRELALIQIFTCVAAAAMLLVTLLFMEQAIFCRSLHYDFSFIGYGGTFQQNACGTKHIPWYPLMFGTGVIFTILMAYQHRNYYHMNALANVAATVTIIACAYVGAKILYLIENPDDWQYALSSFGGVSLFGAIFLVPVFLIPLSGITRRKWSEWMDYAAPIALCMLAVMRIGCFMKGCCASDTIWIGSNPLILPVQLMESALDLILLGYILVLEQKDAFTGLHYPIFISIYSIYRFLLEFIRKTPKNTLGMSNGQIFSLAGILIVGTLTYIYIHKQRRK